MQLYLPYIYSSRKQSCCCLPRNPLLQLSGLDLSHHSDEEVEEGRKPQSCKINTDKSLFNNSGVYSTVMPGSHLGHNDIRTRTVQHI